MKKNNCWKSTPSRVGIDEVGLDLDMGGSDITCGIEYALSLRYGSRT
jgi:hypothetical protein